MFLCDPKTWTTSWEGVKKGQPTSLTDAIDESP